MEAPVRLRHAGLADILPEARSEGLPYVELTTDVSNAASRHVIEANGGVMIERFNKSASYGRAESLRVRIVLSAPAQARGPAQPAQ